MSCECASLQESLVKDMLICVINKHCLHIKQYLLKENDLTLEKTLKIISSMTLSQQRFKQLDGNDESKEASKEIFVIRSKEHFKSQGRHQGSYIRKSH